jgi:flagellar basal-body rod protein FlgC
MTDALSIALSGIKAQQQRLDVAANNIANITTTGRVPTVDNPASTVYKPLNVSLTAQTLGSNSALGNAGGVLANVTQNQNGYSVSFDPSNPYANNDGLIAAPNVDLAQEIVNIIETKAAFRANISVIKTQEKLSGELLDALA